MLGKRTISRVGAGRGKIQGQVQRAKNPGASAESTQDFLNLEPSAVLSLPGHLQPSLPWIAAPKSVSLLCSPCGLARAVGAGWAGCVPSWLPIPDRVPGCAARCRFCRSAPFPLSHRRKIPLPRSSSSQRAPLLPGEGSDVPAHPPSIRDAGKRSCCQGGSRQGRQGSEHIKHCTDTAPGLPGGSARKSQGVLSVFLSPVP